MRPVSRIDWNDLTSLIEGEAIVLFGGRRIYARVFHAAVDDAGPKRLGRTVMLQAPDDDAIRQDLARIGRIASSIETDRLLSPARRKLHRVFPPWSRVSRARRDAPRGHGPARVLRWRRLEPCRRTGLRRALTRRPTARR